VDAVIMMDSDFSHEPCHLPAILARGEELAIGSRYVAGGGVEGWEGWRRILSRSANVYARMVTRMPIADLTGGFNLIHASALRKLDVARLTSSGYAFIIELKYMLWRQGVTFAEVPIQFRSRRGGESKITSHIVIEGVLAPWRLLLR